jgi:AraC family transcriptional regulator
MRLYRESKIEDSATPIVIEGLLLELLGHASRWLSTPKLRLPPWLNTARDICHEHFNDPLNLFQIATLVGVHPTHLARSFRKYFRMTVGDYIRQLRLDWAISRLAETKDSIAEIAIAAGFYDQSHFTNSFKQRIGLSPAEFRASVTNRMR